MKKLYFILLTAMALTLGAWQVQAHSQHDGLFLYH